MGRSILSPSKEKLFGSKMKASIVENRLLCTDVAKKIGVSRKTMSSRFTDPSQMTLGELKLFIKTTHMEKEAVIEYLYEGR